MPSLSSIEIRRLPLRPKGMSAKQVLVVQEKVRSGGGIRFAVGNPNGLRSSTWRIWPNKKGDTYLATRSLGGILKVSFHKDRRCHIGFTSEYAQTAKERFGAERRLLQRWELPEGPVARAAQIVIPYSELTAFESEEATQMRWIPSPGPGFAVVVTLFMAEPPDAFKWENSNSDGMPIAMMCSSTRVAWLVYTNQPWNAQHHDWMEHHRIKSLDLPGAEHAPWGSPEMRTIMWGASESPNDFFILETSGRHPKFEQPSQRS